MTASGALGYDGLGWPWEISLRIAGLVDPSLFTNVIKSLTLYPRRGNFRWYNPFGCFRFVDCCPLPRGTVNAFGLTNPGAKWWCDYVGKYINMEVMKLVASGFGEPDELVEMAIMFNDFEFRANEINASCPNSGEDNLSNSYKVIKSCEKVAEVSMHPQILKLSVVQDVEYILPRVKDFIEAISINSVPWWFIFPNRTSPLAHLDQNGGGVSGKVAQEYTWDFVKRLVDITDIPVIGPSVWDFEDMVLLRMKGAKAISFGSVFIPYPWRPTQYVRQDQRRRTK
jgi:dihydroorotate dehydrogenase